MSVKIIRLCIVLATLQLIFAVDSQWNIRILTEIQPLIVTSAVADNI